MIVQMFDPDVEYARLLTDPDKSKAIRFLRQEAASFIEVKHMIDKCFTDDDFDQLLPKMVEAAGHIRHVSFKCLENQYRVLDFRQKRYICKLLRSMKF